MDFPYIIFGLRVSSNFALPGIEASPEQLTDADLRLHFGAAPPAASQLAERGAELMFASDIQTETGEPVQRIWKTQNGALLRIDYEDGTQFWVDVKGGEVWSRWTENSSFEDAASYMLGPILGYLLRWRGVACLHASAVQQAGRAAVFVGPAGAGKSTLAAALVLRGYAVLSDDIVALAERDGAFYVAPAYPYLSLWPESVEALYGAERDFAAFSPNFPKRMVRLRASERQFAEQPALLESLFLLHERGGDAPLLESIATREAMIWLVANTYGNLLLDDELRGREFALLGRLLGSVPVRRVRAHEDISRIGALCDLIEAEVATGRATARAPANL